MEENTRMPKVPPRKRWPAVYYSVFVVRAKAAISENPAKWVNKPFTAAELWKELGRRTEKPSLGDHMYADFIDRATGEVVDWPTNPRGLAQHIRGLFTHHAKELHDYLGLTVNSSHKDAKGNTQSLYTFIG